MAIPKCYLFDPQYAKIQQLNGYELFASDFGFFPIAIASEVSVSLPNSPFGGFLVDNVNKQELFLWLDQIILDLKTKTNKLIIRQPTSIYPTISTDWLTAYGFEKEVSDISHYINLTSFKLIELHSMQRRKLKSSRFEMNLLSPNQLPEVYEFIKQCRMNQGLAINVSLHSLTDQLETFPDHYLIFTATSNNIIAAACIITIPTDQIAYYYLPATNPVYKKESPMVALMAYIYEYLKTLNFHYLDLGISSINGQPQSSLITFKERMGGIPLSKTTYSFDFTKER